MDNLIVKCAESCGNSPKKKLLKEFTIAIATHDIDFCLDCMKDDIQWEIVGAKQLKGKIEAKRELQHLNVQDYQQLHIHNIITHGNTASVDGMLVGTDENIRFCNVYNFAGFSKDSKIKTITSFVIYTSSC